MQDLIIVKTNIRTDNMVQQLSKAMNAHPEILGWNIDREDVDNVLRIECSGQLSEEEALQLIARKGFEVESLPDL